MTSAKTLPDRPRTRRRWLRPRTFVFALLAMVPIGGLVTWIAAGWFASSELHKAEAEADRLDPGWRFGDILARREAILPSQNTASTMTSVLAKMKGSFPTLPKPRRVGNRLISTQKLITDRIDDVPLGERFDDALAAAIRRELKPHREAIPVARTLATDKKGRTDPKLAKFLWATLLAHAQSSRDVARLLQVDAAVLAHDGQLDAALEDCLAIIGAGRSLGDEPFMITQLVRMAMVSSALATAERVLGQGVASDSTLERLQSLLINEADEPAGITGMRGERAMMDDVFSKLASGDVTVREMSGMGPNAQSTSVEILATASNAFIRYNHAIALRRLTEAVEIAKRPLHEQAALWDRWDKDSAPSDSLITQLASALSREAIPSMSAYGKGLIRNRAQVFAMVTLLAAERHRMAHGAFPASLEAIDPRFLPRTFIDPFSGGPMRYKLGDNGGLTVYSVSADRVDDGGKVMELKKWTFSGQDLGFRLRPAGERARPPKIATLPADVFVDEPPQDDDITP